MLFSFLTSRNDRRYHNLSICSVSGSRSTFELTEDLDAYVATNIHSTIEDDHRSANDIARIQLIESDLSTTSSIQHQTEKTYQQQDVYTDFNASPNYKCFSNPGWALRQRKHNKPMIQKVKDSIKTKRLEFRANKSKVPAESIHLEIRILRTNSGSKMFESYEYPTLKQVRYQCRRLATKYEIHTKQQLVEELVQDEIDRSI